MRGLVRCPCPCGRIRTRRTSAMWSYENRMSFVFPIARATAYGSGRIESHGRR
nr:MAG TPA: hypothetical protein [Caudoviricetes sp.]